MNRIFSTTGGLALLALLVVFSTVIADQPWPGFPTLQSIAPTTPCLTATDQGVTFAFYGYVNHPDGTSTLTWQVTNIGKHDISHVAFGTAGWTRVAPPPGGVYTGDLGTYRIEWTKDKGNPGFASVKYETQFDGFSQGASDTFTLTVSGFDLATPVQVQAKAGRTIGTVTFALADAACDRTPTPTPTPTPASPLPTPTPNPDLTLADYSFGEPQVVLTNTSELLVLKWLRDSKRAIVVTGDSENSQHLQSLGVFNTEAQQFITYGQIGVIYPRIAWLDTAQKLAFLGRESSSRALYISDGHSVPSRITTGNFRGTIAGQGDQVMVLESGSQTPLLFDSNGNPLSLPAINLLDYGINHADTMFGASIRWHPTQPKVAIFDSGGFVTFDLQTGVIQPYTLESNNRHWALAAEWSPDGNQIAMSYVRGEPIFNTMQLALLDVTTGDLTVTSFTLSWISDIAWAPNSKQILIGGDERLTETEFASNLYLFDSSSGETRKLTEFSTYFWPMYRDTNVAWSLDGQGLLFRCRSIEISDSIGLCKTTVKVGASQ